MSSSNKISQASVSQSLPSTSSPIPVVNNQVIAFNSISSCNGDLFSLDKSTGILTILKKGNYTLSYDVLLQNSGRYQSLLGTSVVQNGQVVDDSQLYRVVDAGSIVQLQKSVNFNARKHDQICVVVNYTTSSFQIPVSPLNASFPLDTPVANGYWAPNNYTITYNGHKCEPEDSDSDCGCDQ